MKYKILFFLFFLNCNLFASGISIIRDTEIENYLKEISTPILISAGLNHNDINFYIINDNNINAFVAGGQNIFVNTGTITEFDTPDALLGIIAHEAGHIGGGHLIRGYEKIKNSQNISIGSVLLGIGAMVAGVPELGQAIIFGGLQVQQQDYLAYSRTQEEVADDLATKYLNDNDLSSSALLQSMNKFYLSELDYSSNLEYYTTHPLSRNRKQFIENKVKNEKFNNNEFNEKYKDKYNFIKAKILAYNQTQGNRNFKINVDEKSDYKIYSDAIIAMNDGKINLALEKTNFLINKYKNNPYFYELKGDIYLKNNEIEKALINYDIADNYLKDNVLIKKMIAYIIIKYNQDKFLEEAVRNLNFVIQKEKNDLTNYNLLAEAHYKLDNKDLFYLNLAKYFLLKKEKDKAIKNLELAEKNTNKKEIKRQIEDLKLDL